MINSGCILGGRYEIGDKIGQGGMSYVYRAQDKKLGRVVAIKLLKEEFSEDEAFIKKFKNEAKAAAKLSHPNIVAAYDVVDEGGFHYIVMECVEGITLKNYIARKGHLSNKETLGIALQAAEGIGEAHKKGIIHRDIKPQNMIISKDGKVKVADFGIAKAVTGETVNAAVIGSVHYISPEQARHGVADARSDLYSLGISMYEMITGRVPYEGENTVNVVMAHLSEAMVPPSVYNKEIYPALNDIIQKACRKKPDERYQSAAELIADLKRCVKEPEGHFVAYGEAVSHSAKSVPLPEHGEEKSASGRTHFAETEETGRDTAEGASPERAAEGSAQTESDGTREMQRIMRVCMIGAGVIVVLILLMLIAKASGLFNAFSTAPAETVQTAETPSETETEMDYKISIKGEDLMPDLMGTRVEEAQAKLATMGISMDSSKTEFSDTFYEGTIIGQDPEPDEAVIPGITVHVTVSLGTKASYTLKNIRNMTIEEGTEMLSDAGISVADVRKEFSDSIEKGRIIRWSSVNGKTAEESNEGDSVILVISDGKAAEGVRVPALMNLTQQQAADTLSASGLSLGTVNTQASDAAAGTVLHQSVEANRQVPRGTVVDLIVSTGPQQPAGPVTAGPGETAPLTEESAALSSAQQKEYFYSSIDTISRAGMASGPNMADETINIAVRLAQRVDGSTDYTTLQELGAVPAGTEFPVSFPTIRGAYGVTEGEIQIINADTGEVLDSYPLTFGPR